MTKKRKYIKRLFNYLPWRFFRKLALMQIFVTALIILTTAFIARHYLRTYIILQAEVQLKDSLQIWEETLKTQKIDPLKWCDSFQMSLKNRYSLISWDGQLLCDNYINVEGTDNHSNREEVVLAKENGFGKASRISETTKREMLYGAVRFHAPNGQDYIIRQAVVLDQVVEGMRKLDRTILFFLFPLLIATSLLAFWTSLQVSIPLRSILRKIEKMKKFVPQYNIDSNFTDTPVDEWVFVEKTLDRAKKNLEKYLKELYRENEKISILMESISDGILAIDKNHEILFANKNFQQKFLPEVDNINEIVEYKIWEIIRSADLKKLFDEAFQTKQVVKSLNTALTPGLNNTNYFCDLTISPLVDSKGKTFGAVCVFHDVTERKLADQMREDFVANVSHEVRTPLTALKGYVQILKQSLSDSNDPDIIDYLNKVIRNSDRLTILFNDILNLSVIESKQKMSKEHIRIEELSSNVISNIKQNLKNSNVVIEEKYEIETVYANGPFLEQVMTNLIDNACKYTPKENAKVWVTWSEKDNFDIFEVRDNGLGIPKEHHSRLFERFYRVDPSRSSEITGSGLGLAIVKHIVQKHEGKISVKNAEQGGTIFTVKIPKKIKGPYYLGA